MIKNILIEWREVKRSERNDLLVDPTLSQKRTTEDYGSLSWLPVGSSHMDWFQNKSRL